MTARGEAPPADITVAPAGDDANSGGPGKPVKTIARAQQLVRERLAAGKLTPGGALVVEIAGGQYFLEQPLEFTPADSAPTGARVIYRAKLGDRVVVSGGRPITGWRVVNGRWRVELSEVAAGKWFFRELFVGGRRAIRAREPNAGYFRVEKAGPDRRTSFTYKQGDLSAGEKLAGAELVFLHDWSTSRIKIAAVDPATRTLKTAAPIGSAAPHYAIDHFEKQPRYFVDRVGRATGISRDPALSQNRTYGAVYGSCFK